MPIIYAELKNNTIERMNTVVLRGTWVCAVIYVCTGIFGYVTFANIPDVLNTQNILDAPYKKNLMIDIGRVA